MTRSSGTPFYKLSGAGNDFVALVLEKDVQPPEPETLRAWCRRGVGIGADGVLALRRTAEGARMVYWNADGGRSDLCLNGSRCAVRLAFELGWAEKYLVLSTDAGPIAGRRLGDSRAEVVLPARLTEGQPEALRLSVRPARGEPIAVDAHRVDVGVPHLVVSCGQLGDVPISDIPIATLGPALRHHPDLGSAGANVDFVAWPTPASDRTDRFALRSWERGVEGETLACGTGVIASALVGVTTGRTSLPVRVSTASGFELTVGRAGTGDGGGLTLAGDARIVARGEILDDARAVPP